MAGSIDEQSSVVEPRCVPDRCCIDDPEALAALAVFAVFVVLLVVLMGSVMFLVLFLVLVVLLVLLVLFAKLNSAGNRIRREQRKPFLHTSGAKDGREGILY